VNNEQGYLLAGLDAGVVAKKSPRDVIINAWTALTYKLGFEKENGRTVGWLTKEDVQRLDAYVMLAGYDRNASRYWLEDQHAQSNRREYGDAHLLIETTLGALLGDDQTIAVVDADNYDPNMAADADADKKTANGKLKPSWDAQEMLREWADREGLKANLQLSERNGVALGDGVYVLRWSEAKKRPRLQVPHPGTYFPELATDGNTSEDYPTVVHFAWEAERNGKPVLWRQTYRLGAIRPQTETAVIGEKLRRQVRFDPETGLSMRDGDQFDERLGLYTRSFPWNNTDDGPSTITCYYSEGWWSIDNHGVAQADVYTLDPNKANWTVRHDGEVMEEFDLNIDFIPVIHVPNTVAGPDHFGQSSLNPVLQLVDDVQSSDTDNQASSATTGRPMVAVSGVNQPAKQKDDPLGPPTGTLEPGVVLFLGPDGKITTLDTSPMLAAGQNYTDGLLKRLSTNARLPGALLGTISPADVPSGFALSLSFGPLKTMIEAMRLTRSEKHPLLMKFVQRMFQNDKQLPAGDTFEATIDLGSYMPSDQDLEIERILGLYAAKLISLETAIKMLQTAGVPIEDVQEEIDRIERRSFEEALSLAEATGVAADARTFLHLEPVTPPPTPTPTPVPVPVPPGGNQPPVVTLPTA
jgi:hypothetical protein